LKVKPVVDASVIVPCATDSMREFKPVPAEAPLKLKMLMPLPLFGEKTSDPFWSSVPEGGPTSAGALSAVTVKTTVVAADRLSPRSESERDKESDRTCVAVVLSLRPLKAGSGFAAEPDTVNDAEPSVPVVKLKPAADTSAIVPCATDRVREFEPLPAAAPLELRALPLLVEKTSDPFWSSVPAGVATSGGVLSAVTVETTGAAADGPSPRSELERDKEPAPTCAALGLEVTPLRGAFRFAAEPDTVKEGDALATVVKLNPVAEPEVSLPCETESESELLSAAASITEIGLLLALEKTSEMSVAVPGVVSAGAARALTVSDALLELDSAYPG